MKKSESRNLKNAMQRPLILGASVSGDYFCPSPGKRLALRYTAANNVKVVARRGTPGREVIRSTPQTAMEDRSAIICIDTFFWDSFSDSTAATEQALRRLVDFARDKSIPLVVGEVPEFMPLVQRSAARLNEAMRTAAKDNPHVHVLPLNTILNETLEKGYIVHEGDEVPIESLLPDGLHISTRASDYLADKIAALLED